MIKTFLHHLGHSIKMLIKDIVRYLKDLKNPKGGDIYSRFAQQALFYAIMASIIAGLILLFSIFYMKIGTKIVKVPNVVGKDILDGTLLVERNGLQHTIDGVFDNEHERFEIIEQFPAGESSVHKGKVIRLQVSKGKDIYTVPDIIGKTKSEIKDLLIDNNIPFEFITIKDDRYDREEIVSLDKKVGTQVERSDKLSIVVNDSILSSEYMVENYVNLPVSAVVPTLYAKGVIPILEKVIVETEGQDGIIQAQNVSEGGIVQKNSSIRLTVGIYGRDDIERDKYNYYIVRYYLGNVDIPLIHKKDENGNPILDVYLEVEDSLSPKKVLVNREMTPYQVVTGVFKGFGKTKVKLYVNKRLEREWTYGR